jgi:hypothetical protein
MGCCCFFKKKKKKKTRALRNGWLFLKKKKETRVVRNGLLLVCRPRGRGDSTVAHDIDGDQSLRVRDLQQRVSAGSEPAVTQTGP